MTAARIARLAQCRLYLVASVPVGSDPADPGPAWWRAVEGAVRGGAGAVQLRAKGTTTATLIGLLIRARERLAPSTLLIVNDDLDAARGSGADGLHLGREDAEVLGGAGPGARGRGLRHARQLLGLEALLGASTRSLREVLDAVAAGADHVGFGALAASATKSDSVLASPGELAATLRAHPGLPIFPIGGLGPDTLGIILAAGARRAAVGAAVLGAPDPEAAARRIHDALSAP